MFKNKVIIITGGSSGVGKELSIRLAQSGAHLAIIAREKSKLNAVKEQLSKSAATGQKIEAYSCDVSSFDAVQETFSRVAKDLGLPDILINSAGILRESYFEKQSLDTFRETMAINFFGTLHCIKAVLPFFKQKQEGRIVNISSTAGLLGVFGYSAYCSSKYALVGLTEALRSEFKPQHIKFHLVCPPEFESPMVDDLNTYRTLENQTVVHTIPVLSVDAVATAIIKGMEKDRYLIIPGAITKIVTTFNRLFPFLGRLVVDTQIKKVYRGPDKQS